MVKVVRKVDLYEKLLAKYKEIMLLRNVSGQITWDFEVMMPKKGGQQRGEELALMSGLIHDRNTDPKIGSLLKEIKAHKDYENLSDIQKRNVLLFQRNYDKQTRIPTSFAQKLTKHGAAATQTWKEGRSKADYSIFKKDLEKMVELKKQQAAYLNPDLDPYDVLLDNFERGFSKEIFDKVFQEAKAGLIPIIKACLDSPNQPDSSLVLRECPIDIQRKVVHDLAEIVQYNLKGGRIDVAVHPFSTGYFDDVRITVSYNNNDFTDSFFAGMHECGHALYEQNYPAKFKYQPIGSSSSSAMHEGQARFIENIIGRSSEFWEFYLPRFKDLTQGLFDDVKLKPFIHAVNQVKQTKIRIHADPVTYSLHIIMRYELEKELFDDKLTISELPAFWNEKMKEYLGVDIENDTEGILQDTHWAWGLFAYFPTYALGSYYNAQFQTQLTKDIPEWKTQMKNGNISNILGWLNTNIRNKGNLYDPLDMIKNVTGKEFSAKYFIEATGEKYSKIYDL
ncbi:MAG: carboxypeptidase M32 [Candidatus Heimdallarchaeota archaeon]|nr:carboxypeptidase M32 [Candidatus Heimdallarchaeota archaeon]MBY8995569.1 carboxypeptidase M32 [Candidatus Heimdallarchaeota archaeon]